MSLNLLVNEDPYRLIIGSGYGVRSILKEVQIFRDTNTVVDPAISFVYDDGE